jgi:hypothetical protein
VDPPSPAGLFFRGVDVSENVQPVHDPLAIPGNPSETVEFIFVTFDISELFQELPSAINQTRRTY